MGAIAVDKFFSADLWEKHESNSTYTGFNAEMYLFKDKKWHKS